MTTLYWIVSALIFIPILIFSIERISKVFKKNVKRNYSQNISKEDSQFLQRIKELFFNDEILSNLQLMEILGIPENSGITKNNEFNRYKNAIDNRFKLKTYQLIPLDSNNYNLLLRENEKLYHCIRGTSLFKEKIVSTNITYSGVKWNTKFTRAGSLSYAKNDIIRFSKIDDGSIFFTNERLIFLGKKNKAISVKFENIVSYEIYIDGILLIQPNLKPILLQFYQSSPIFLQDGRNEFLIVLSRILNNNIDVNLSEQSYNFEDLNEEDLDEHGKEAIRLIKLSRKKLDELKSGNMKLYNELKNIE